jgi:hypothetical protein
VRNDPTAAAAETAATIVVAEVAARRDIIAPLTDAEKAGSCGSDLAEIT